MSDRTSVNLIVWKASDRMLAKINAALRDEWLINEDAVLGDVVYGEEVALDAHDEITAKIREVAPGTVFEVWVDAKYEWPAILNQYVPRLGVFSSMSNSDGEVLISRDRVLELMVMRKPERERALGLPWQRAIHRAKAALQETTDAGQQAAPPQP